MHNLHTQLNAMKVCFYYYYIIFLAKISVLNIPESIRLGHIPHFDTKKEKRIRYYLLGLH